jgi:hypothetical protein
MLATDSNSTFILSLDYELFFGRSGSIEDCLLKPCALMDSFCREHSLQVTYFIDAGMLVRLRELATAHTTLHRTYDTIRRHIEGLGVQGHEIGLHIHPHWEETRWTNGEWDFANTRYRLDQFDKTEVHRIVIDYAKELQNLTSEPLASYRAGGFCVEPFGIVRDALLEVGITIDSSVVPGATLIDGDKGFDFANVPDRPGWRFSSSPLKEEAGGEFIEVPITPHRLPFFHYWGRLLDRVVPRKVSGGSGEGRSKAIGRTEAIRRLAGRSNVSELSIDHAKAKQLTKKSDEVGDRSVWHAMGHPKLVTSQSLASLKTFLNAKRSWACHTVKGFSELKV